ncbi:response regulator transcription factor [Ruegeria hyattellae]|uniref:response regulator transcription factor n=1 Tax=Ruegeria hyattellae TaxID=3233337 RepID=UPI00355B2BBC
MRLQIIEDNPALRDGLADLLSVEGFACETFGDGHAALGAFEVLPFDVVLLDVVLPGLDGLDLCKRFRQISPKTQILILSARGEPIDRRLGIEIGADDYVSKPFDPGELKARVLAMARRLSHTAPPADGFQMADLWIDTSRLAAIRGAIRTVLNSRELAILRLLFENSGCPVSRDMLFDTCWGRDYFPNSRALDQYVSVLRRKIERDPQNPKIIQTVRGIGYRFTPPF